MQTEIEVRYMGAYPCAKGIAFRVWAPNAEKVSVIGTFNDFKKDAHPMKKEENGNWFLEIPEAKFGDQYKYNLINGAKEMSRNDPYAREVTNSAGNSIIVDPYYNWEDDNFTLDAWNKLVIYEMHVGTFFVKKEGKPGDFKSVIEKLPHLKNLGINVIQIMPPLEFPGSFSWGYNPSFPYALESDYGGAEAFKDLVKAAHKIGIGVILDVVYNHFGPGDLDMWQFDGWSENDGGGIYFYNDWRAKTPWGNTRPDYGRGEVRTYLKDNALMWIKEFHVDGLRFDSVLYMRNADGQPDHPPTDIPEAWSILQWINEEVKEAKPEALTIAEDLTGNPWVTKDIGAGGAGFNTQWDSSFVHPVRHAIITAEDADRDMNAVKEAIIKYYNDDHLHRVIYTESHDEVANGSARVPEQIWPGKVGSWVSKKRSTLGAGLVFTSPGIPMIFQGQEFLTDKWFDDTNPLQWSKADKYDGLVNMYKEMISLRRNLYDNTAGLSGAFVQVHHVDNNNKTIAFHRWDEGGPGDSVIVILNFANVVKENYNIGFPVGGIWKLRLNSDWEGYDSKFCNQETLDTEAREGFKDGMPFNANVNIGAYSILIYSQDKN